jgi:ATP-dependent DNA helicase RecQ
VHKVARDEMLSELDWLIEIVKEKNIHTPKTIIFCSTLYDIASVVNYMMTKLGAKAFFPSTSKERKDCVLGIYHSSTMIQYKKRVTESLKLNGVKRIVMATTALSMGVNFPDIRFVLMFGPPRSLIDFHQEAGRAGRDNEQSDIILSFYGQQLAHCDEEMYSFLKSTGCLRVAAIIA